MDPLVYQYSPFVHTCFAGAFVIVMLCTLLLAVAGIVHVVQGRRERYRDRRR
jgi:hypothetical protein